MKEMIPKNFGSIRSLAFRGLWVRDGRTRGHAHTHRHTHACAHTHTCTHTHMHTHTHTHIYIYIHMCMYMQFVFYIAEGSLGVKLPTIWTDGKAEVGRVRRETVKRKKIQVRGKVEESRNTVFFPRAFERRVLLVVGVCQTFSHLHIFT